MVPFGRAYATLPKKRNRYSNGAQFRIKCSALNQSGLKKNLLTEFVVLVTGDIFSCHAVDNPDFESEMVSSKY